MTRLATYDTGVVATASVRVENTGTLDGTEVVQVYVQDPVMDYVRPWKRLLAFQRVTLRGGEARKVDIPLLEEDIAFYDDDMKFRLVPGEYNISCGSNSYEAAYLTAALQL